MCDLCVGKGTTTKYDVLWKGFEFKIELCSNCWTELQFNLSICEEFAKNLIKER